MSVLWAIKDWDEVFEDRRSRAVDRLQFLACRVLDRKSEAYAILVALPGGVEAYGVFWALVLVAARCSPRGILADDKGILTPSRLAAKTRMPCEAIERAIGLLTRADIGWLVPSDSAPSARRPRDAQTATSAVGAPSDPPSERRADGGKGNCAPSARATQQQHNINSNSNSAAAAGVALTGEEVEQRRAWLAKRPDWLPEGKPWIEPGVAAELASMPALMPENVNVVFKAAKDSRSQLKNPAGFIVKRLREVAAGGGAA